MTYPLWFRGITQLSAPVAAFLGLLSPMSATVLGWTVKHETFTPLQMLGFVIVLASIVAGQRAPRAAASTRRAALEA
jgi:probable blue pigment (indigoidine) exporter